MHMSSHVNDIQIRLTYTALLGKNFCPSNTVNDRKIKQKVSISSPVRAVQANDTYELSCDFNHASKESINKNIQMSAQSSPVRAVQEKILTYCHEFFVQDAEVAYERKYKMSAQSSPEDSMPSSSCCVAADTRSEGRSSELCLEGLRH
eukprot:409603-Hanusia_phi.AAC.1